MSNPNPNDRPETDNDRSNFLDRLVKKATSPSTLIIAVTAIALGAVAYEGVKVLIARNLPPYVEQQLEAIVNRPVKLGEIRNISLNGAEIGGLSIPATANDSDRISIANIKVGFNILPVIFTRTLPVEITLVKPEIYLEQDKQGAWVNLNLKTQPGKESIYIDTKVNVRQGKITAVPYQKSPLIIPVDGNGRYNPNKNKQVTYDFQTAIAAAKANIQGETTIETGKTQAKVLLKDLVLADLVPLIPNSPVDVNRGNLNANLAINFPSFKEFEATRIQGKVSLQQVQAEAKPIPTPIEAISELLFGGNKVKIEDTQGSVGEVVAQVSGGLNLAKGYDVDVRVLPFTLANLAKTLPVKLPVAMEGGLQADLQLKGAVDRPKLTGNINSTQPVQIDRTKFAQINTNFAADLNKFVLKNLQLKPSAGGEIRGTGIVETKLNKLVQTKGAIAWQNMPMAFDFQAELPTEKLVSPYYRLPSEIKIGQISAKGKVGGTAGKPLASLNWQAPSMSAQNITNIAGVGEVTLVGKDLLVRNTEVKVGEGKITVNGKGNFDRNQWQTLIATKSIPINPFLSEIRSPQLNLDRPIALENGKVNLAGTFDSDILEKIDGVANLDVKVAEGKVKLDSKLNAGNLQASVVSDRLAIEQFVTTLPLPATVETSQINLAGKLKQLLSFNANSPNLDGWEATAKAKLAVADGTVNATGKLKDNLWQTDLSADNLNSTLLSTRLIPNTNRSLFDLPNLNAKANLSGNLLPLLQPNFATTIKANDLSLQLGNQAIAATGTILLSKMGKGELPKMGKGELPFAPTVDLAGNFNIKANTDLDTLPVRQNVLAQQKINLKGDADFQGNLQGKNLLTAPLNPGNLQLTGKIKLANASFNKIVFDRILAGNVNAALGKDISINLRGKGDLIAAAFTPCHSAENKELAIASNNRECVLPYLPEYVELKVGEGTSYPVIASGKRDRDNFNLNIQNFPLSILNVSPATTVGIVAPVGGDLTGNLNLNLFDLSAKGNIQIDKPAISYLEAKNITADFNYDRAKNIARLTSASLLLRKSRYNLQGNLDLNTGGVEGALDIPEAYIQDLLTTLRWFDLPSLMQLFQNDYKTKAIAVKPGAIGTSGQTLSNQINLLAEIEGRIEEVAARRQAGDIPTQLDIRGAYRGRFNLVGTLSDPELDFKLEGNNWQWRTQSETLAIVDPLGLIKEGTRDIPIDRFSFSGNYADGIASLQPSEIKLGKAILAMQGKLLPNQQADATVNVKDLSIDFLRNFAEVPLDLDGKIDSEINLKGAVSKPRIDGKVSFTNAVINANALPGAIAGEFNYDGSRLQFQTTEQSIVQAQANVPYPIEPGGSDRFDVGIQLGTQTIALIDPLTQGQLSWVEGEGAVNLNASGRIDLNKQSKVYDLSAKGEVDLNNATLKTKTFPATMQVNGKILLKDSFIEVEQLQGQVAKRDFSVAGVLPILVPQPDLANPLTVNLEKGNIEVEKLYEGGIEGNVQVTGSAFNPLIGGNVSLYDGQATVPGAPTQPNTNSATNPNLVANGASQSNTQSPVVAKLNNFQVNLDNFRLEQTPIYKVNVGGQLTLNGIANNPNSIRSKGTLELRRADVDFLSNEFRLRRSYKNKVVFNPKRSILNPDLDLQLITQVSDYANFRQAAVNENEIPEYISKSGKAQTIDVNLNIKGQANQLLASLGQASADPCQIDSANDRPLGDRTLYPPEKLKQVETCISANAYNDSNNTANFQILNAPIVKLTSNPPRSEGEIVGLLGNQFIELAKQLQQSNQDQLLEFGASQFIIKPITREATYLTDETFNNFGRAIGLDYFRVYPTVQGIYELNRESQIDLTYDYFVDEIKLRYELRF
jgi:hypothetical protein